MLGISLALNALIAVCAVSWDHVQDYIANPQNMDLIHAMTHIQDMSQEEINEPVFGDRPILHHILNLYFQSRNVRDRKTLVEIGHMLIDSGADVNAQFNNDPHVLFKAVLLREMGLAKSVAEAGSVLNSPLALQQLYSVPCDPIPLSKLLLHAGSIIEKMKESARKDGKEFTTGDVLSLLAGASLGVGAKAAVNSQELAAMSPTYSGLVEDIFTDPSFDVPLMTVLESLDEVASTIHRSLLAAPLAVIDPGTLSEHIGSLLVASENNGRNVLHTLGLSGGASMVRDLVEIFSKASDEGKRLLAQVISAKDSRDHTPLSYAALRYGSKSKVFISMRRLHDLAGVDVSESHLSALLSSHIPPERHGSSNDSIKHFEVEVESDGVHASALPVTERENGGWSTALLDDPLLLGDRDRCDIPEVWSGVPSPLEFYTQYVARGQPVIFRGALSNNSDSLRHVLSRSEFLSRFGSESMPVSAIPYAGSFGKRGQMQTLDEIASLSSDRSETSIPSPDEPPGYAFNVALPQWKEKIETAVGLPSVLNGLVKDVEMQFYLGGAGTGAPVHYHGHAVNSLAHGEKVCLLYSTGYM